MHAPLQLSEQIRRQRECLRDGHLKVVRDSVARNSYMGHPENILLAMLGDLEESTRAESVGLIKEMRGRRGQQSVRRFRKPVINFSARSYTDMIDTREAATSAEIEPPYTIFFLHSATPLTTDVPNNTQSTERAVRLTTEAASTVEGAARQDGHCLNKKAFRQRCPGQVTRETFSRLRE